MKIFCRDSKSQFFSHFADCGFQKLCACLHMSCGRYIVTTRIGILASTSFLKQHIIIFAMFCLFFTDNPHMDRCMRTSFSMHHTTLFCYAGFISIFIQYIEKLHRLSIQCCCNQLVSAVIGQFQREKFFLFIQQTEEDLISLPDIQMPYFFDIHPFQFAFIA